MIERVNRAFADAFTIEELTRLMRFDFNIDLEDISSGNNDKIQVIFDLTRWADKAEKLEQLIRAAKAATTNVQIHALPDTISRANKKRMDSEQLVLLLFRLEAVEKAVDEIKRIVTGPDGDNGVRSLARDNARKLENIRNTLNRLEIAVSEKPQSFQDIRSKLVFGVILALLAGTFAIVALGSLGLIQGS